MAATAIRSAPLSRHSRTRVTIRAWWTASWAQDPGRAQGFPEGAGHPGHRPPRRRDDGEARYRRTERRRRSVEPVGLAEYERFVVRLECQAVGFRREEVTRPQREEEGREPASRPSRVHVARDFSRRYTDS